MVVKLDQMKTVYYPPRYCYFKESKLLKIALADDRCCQFINTMSSKSEAYKTPLATAAYMGSVDVFRLLMQHGADFDFISPNNRNLLHYSLVDDGDEDDDDDDIMLKWLS
jgi:hypothetical protein